VSIEGKNIVSQPNEGGVVLTSEDGTEYYTTLEAPEEIEIEEQGPMRMVVKVRGVFKAEDGSFFAPPVHGSVDFPDFDQPYVHSFVYYNCRIHFYNNKEYVKVFFTLENNGANGRTNPEPYFSPVQIVYFDSVNLILKTNNASAADILSEDSYAQLASSDSFVLYQDWNENVADDIKDTLEPNFEKGVYYSTEKNTQQLSSGSTNPGWIDKNSNFQGVGLAFRHFWQNFPKKLTVSPTEIKIGLWPEEGYYPYCRSADFTDPKYDIYCKEAGKDGGVYLFDAGRHKTYEMLLRFYSDPQNSQTQILSSSLESPLMALAPSEWYAQTKVLGLIGPSGLTSTDLEINEAMERYEKLQTAMVYEEDSENAITIQNLKTMNPPHWEFSIQNRFFNWMNFGDLLWSNKAPCALHYDWTYKMLLHYVRTGKRNFFDTGVEMVKHRYDIDQYHGERIRIKNQSHKYTNHFQFYETSGHADPTLQHYFPSKPSGPAHTWNGGLVLYYLLSGDKLALEAAEGNGKAVLNRYGSGGISDANIPKCASSEFRSEGWSMLILINLYRVTGKSEYIDTAKNIAKNKMLYKEQQVGGNGSFGENITNSYVNRALDAVGVDCVESGCGTCKNVVFPLMVAYLGESLMATHYETQDEELGSLIVRMADFLKDELLFGGDYDKNGKYRPIQTVWMWVEEDPDGFIRNPDEGYGGGGQVLWTLYWVDYFAYAYRLTGNSEYLDLARKCFRDMMFYYAAESNGFYSNGVPRGYIDPNTRSKISFTEGMFPGSHTKVHGWLGRTNQVYLYTEWQLQQGGDILGDINKDDILDINDYITIISTLGKQKDETGYNPNADYDANNKVTYSDFIIWYNYYQGRIS